MKKYEEMAWDLLEEYGLTDLGWAFDWHKNKRSFGTCNYTKKTIYLSSIMSPLRAEEDVIRTIYHEIAHALTQGDGHGSMWKRTMHDFGYPNITATTRDPGTYVRPYTWVLKFGDELIKGYYRKPNPSTFTKLCDTWINGRKSETYGKLELIPC